MKTLALVQGDLAIVPGGYLTYTGVDKINQDVSMALKEQYGSDPFHIRWGSVLQNFVGRPITTELRGQVVSEINRVLRNYISVQNSQLAQASNSGTPSVLSANDVVQSVASISAVQNYDSLVVRVVLETLARQTITVAEIVTS